MIIRKLAILTIALTFASAFLIQAGVVSDFGTRPQPGAGSAVSDSQAAASNISSERTSLRDSFSGGMIATVGKITQLDDTIFALPTVLTNLAIPNWIVDFVTGPLLIATAFDILSIIRGVIIQ